MRAERFELRSQWQHGDDSSDLNINIEMIAVRHFKRSEVSSSSVWLQAFAFSRSSLCRLCGLHCTSPALWGHGNFNEKTHPKPRIYSKTSATEPTLGITYINVTFNHPRSAVLPCVVACSAFAIQGCLPVTSMRFDTVCSGYNHSRCRTQVQRLAVSVPLPVVASIGLPVRAPCLVGSMQEFGVVEESSDSCVPR